MGAVARRGGEVWVDAGHVRRKWNASLGVCLKAEKCCSIRLGRCFDLCRRGGLLYEYDRRRTMAVAERGDRRWRLSQ